MKKPKKSKSKTLKRAKKLVPWDIPFDGKTCTPIKIKTPEEWNQAWDQAMEIRMARISIFIGMCGIGLACAAFWLGTLVGR